MKKSPHSSALGERSRFGPPPFFAGPPAGNFQTIRAKRTFRRRFLFITAALSAILIGIQIPAVVFASSSASAPEVQFQKTLRKTMSSLDGATSVQQTADGGYIAAGSSHFANGNSDAWVAKLNKTGSLEWQKFFGGSGMDFAQSIQRTTDGGFILAGGSDSNNGGVSGNRGASDMWVVKLNPGGSPEWQKLFGGSSDDSASSIQQTSDGGYIVAGTSYSNDGNVTGNHGNGDFWVVKLGPQGSLEWQKSLGGSEWESASSVRQAADGGYIVAGRAGSNDGDVTGNHGNGDCWVVKLGPQGSLEWQKSFGGSASEEALSIQQTSDGGYIAAGWSNSNDGDVSGNRGGQDGWIVKLSPNGSLEWQKTFGGSGDDGAKDIQQTSDGGYIAAGASSSKDGDAGENHGERDFWLLKISQAGALEWQTSLGGAGTDDAESIQQTADGGYIVAGSSTSNNSGGHWDFCIFKLGPPPKPMVSPVW